MDMVAEFKRLAEQQRQWELARDAKMENLLQLAGLDEFEFISWVREKLAE